MSRRRQAAFIVLAAVAVSQAYRPGVLGPLVVGSGLIAINVIGVLWLTHRGRGSVMTAKSFSAPIAICWLVVSILPVHEFSGGDSASAVSAVSLEAMIEFVVFIGVGIVAALIIRTYESDLQRARPPAILFLIPIWVIWSGFWGQWAPYSFARGLQFITIAFLAWATIALCRADASVVRPIIELYLRWFVRVTAVLAVLGLLWGPIFVKALETNLERFSWIGAHPNSSGLVLSVATIVVLATPPRILRLPPPIAAAFGFAFLAALFLNHSRTAWVALAASIVAVLVMQGRLSPRVVWIGIPGLSAFVIAAMWLNGTAIWDYILRDKSSESLRKGNGRLDLWGIGFQTLDTAFDWLAGLGYGASRVIFLEEAPWAGSAHNSVLAYLVSLGLIGTTLFLYTVTVTSVRLFRSNLWSRGDLGVPMSALMVIVVVNAMTGDSMAEPSLGFSVLSLVTAMVIVAGQREPETTEEHAVASDDAPRRHRVA